MPSVFLFLVCLPTDLKGALHNGTAKPLRGEHKRPKGKWKNKAKGGGKEDKREGGGGTEGGGKILARHQTEEWVEKERREGGKFKRRDLLNQPGVHAPP